MITVLCCQKINPLRSTTQRNIEITINRNPLRAPNSAFRRLYPVLDQAIDHLRTPDREVIVRRYLEGQDFQRIGEALGISEDAAQKRTSRAFERLNRFFKRRAGVTVSATVLAAGISRHCAEAAPAACLDITGMAGFGLTTGSVATIGMGKLTAVAAGVIVLGGAMAYFATQGRSPDNVTATAPPPSSTESAPAGPSPVDPADAAEAGGSPEGATADLSDSERERLEAMSPHPGKAGFARRVSIQHDQLLRDLTADLGLAAAQAASVKDVLDLRLAAFRASLDVGPQPGNPQEESLVKEKEMLAQAGGIIRGNGLREGLADILSDEQLAAFDEREEKAWQSQVEAHAYRELSKLMPVLGLTDEQRALTLELLKKSSAEKLSESADIRAFMALQQGQSPSQLEMTDMAEAEFLHEAMDGPNPLAPDSPEFRERFAEVVGAQIRKRIELLAPVLDERQRRLYRDHLIQNSLLPTFGIELPDLEQP